MKQRQELLDSAKVKKRVCEKKRNYSYRITWFYKVWENTKTMLHSRHAEMTEVNSAAFSPPETMPPIKSAIYLWIQTICSNSPSHCTLNSAGWDNDSAFPTCFFCPKTPFKGKFTSTKPTQCLKRDV